MNKIRRKEKPAEARGRAPWGETEQAQGGPEVPSECASQCLQVRN